MAFDVLSDNINNFNDAINLATEKFSKSPKEFSSGLYSMVLNVNEAVVPLAMALLMTYFIFSFYEKAVTFKMKNYEVFGTAIINLALGFTILKNNVNILNIFYYISNTVLNKIMLTDTGSILIEPEVITSLWEDISFWDGVGPFIEMVFCQLLLVIILFVANFIITFAVISRMFEIYIYMALAPIAFCSFVSDTTRGIFKTYMTNFCSILLKSSIIVLTLQMYQVYVIDAVSILPQEGMGYFWNCCISGILVITLILGAEKISKTVVGTLK